MTDPFLKSYQANHLKAEKRISELEKLLDSQHFDLSEKNEKISQLEKALREIHNQTLPHSKNILLWKIKQKCEKVLDLKER